MCVCGLGGGGGVSLFGKLEAASTVKLVDLLLHHAVYSVFATQEEAINTAEQYT